MELHEVETGFLTTGRVVETKPRAPDVPVRLSQLLPELAGWLRTDVAVLAEELGERNLRNRRTRGRVRLAERYIHQRLGELGLDPRRLPYRVGLRTLHNLEVEFPGTTRPDEILVMGAHYDTAKKARGANDNATGVAALLALAAGLRRRGPLARTVRLVAFCTEEPPYTRTRKMGSYRYARRCRRRNDDVRAMISLEMLGAPAPRLLARPLGDDFMFAVGDRRSKDVLGVLRESFSESGTLRLHTLRAPTFLPPFNASDHWSFWKNGFPAVMLTDGGPLRYAHYHRRSDAFDRVDFTRFEAVVEAAFHALRRLASDGDGREDTSAPPVSS